MRSLALRSRCQMDACYVVINDLLTAQKILSAKSIVTANFKTL